ncbi:1,4-alpha-glucan branching protein GlgB [Larsenimonas rhizosphaerae]|uniref:1,4-alpha-glucan branching enzyme GlgB n=1 Tax=Larsenimonas rhizosphaerae TaxID=2944682 RepID=A0AA42CSV4_9GAMM|nr:1,4-alpha-glucan branching protein GlgB [Larsenimonas rhizosphaerae]MCX2522952.1 1,4-alpha-glucan branching protein GlgB [Larsenimonas rhizosphaerae]
MTTMSVSCPTPDEIERNALTRLGTASHGHPFDWLGPHVNGDICIVRGLFPGAEQVELIGPDDALLALAEHQVEGVFRACLPLNTSYRFRVRWPDGRELVTQDAYRFDPMPGELDLYLFSEGRHRELAHVFGATVVKVDGVAGVRFTLWAPNAQRVSVIGAFNQWDGRRHPMTPHDESGIWALFVPHLEEGECYCFEMLDYHGEARRKADPLARQSALENQVASIVTGNRLYDWHDNAWLQRRSTTDMRRAPLSIYELHVLSWQHDHEGKTLGWDDLASRLIPWVADLGFTHIELMPVSEHPFVGSWGYQPIGLFAPMSRMGTPESFARFVDACHTAGIGIIIDWVPAHFPSDEFGLVNFDGTALYEHADPREGFHPDWNTLIYNVGRHEVRGFLIASALEWFERFHIDGLRVDAVASMLYRDYSRESDAWVPNVHGGRENLEVIEFLRELNTTVADRCPGTMMIAEESTAWPGVTASVEMGGLGFTFKWNMGWMHDTLNYMGRDPLFRRHHHHELTFGLHYAFSEHFILPLSHDEVVHGKGSMLGKMPGDEATRLAGLRAYIAFMWGHPGKKLLFMGAEIGQWREWDHDHELDWQRLDEAGPRGLSRSIADLNRIYVSDPALHARDTDPGGFSWVVKDDYENSVFAFLRYAEQGKAPLLVVCNMTPVVRHEYHIGVPVMSAWREVFNSDSRFYGGSNMGNGSAVHAHPEPSHGQPASLRLTLPPMSTLYLRQGDWPT